MASLAKLVVSITGNTVQLNKSLNKAESRTKKFQRGASKSLSLLKVGLAGLAVGIAAFSVKAVQDYASVGDEIDKMSKRTGFSAESLSKLRFAAEQSGAELSTVEKGAKRMAAVLLDAELGLKTSTDSLELLNLNLTDFDAISPDEKFFKFAQAISKVEDPTRRAALAQKIFGRAGTELLPLFQEGEEGLAALSAQAEKLGIVYSQKAAADAAEFKDAQNALGKALQGFLAKGIAPLLPKLTKMINAIVENEEVLNAMGQTIIFVADAVIRFFDKVQVAITGIQDFIQVIKDFVKDVEKALDKIPDIFTGAFENAYLGSIPWIARGKLLTDIESLPSSIDKALESVPGIFAATFGKAYDLVNESFKAAFEMAQTAEVQFIVSSKMAEALSIGSAHAARNIYLANKASREMELGIVRIKSATELATEAFIAQSHAYEGLAKGAAHAARNIYLAEQATRSHAAAFAAIEAQAKATLGNEDARLARHFGGLGTGGGSVVPQPSRRFGSELGDADAIFSQLSQLLAGTLTSGEANAQNKSVLAVDGKELWQALEPHANQQILEDREMVSR